MAIMIKSKFLQLIVRILEKIPFPWVIKIFDMYLFTLYKVEPAQALKNVFLLDDLLTRHTDILAIKYEKNDIHPKHRLMKYHDFFVDRLRPGETVLDIGCGIGAVAYSMASRAQADVTGIDMDAGNIQKAIEKFQAPNLRFIHGDALKFLPEGHFETIVFSNVLEHIQYRVEFLRSVNERLKPARWLIRVPMYNRSWIVPLRQELGLPYFSDSTHYTEYTQQSFEDEITQAGMKIDFIQINWGEIWAEVSQP